MHSMRMTTCLSHALPTRNLHIVGGFTLASTQRAIKHQGFTHTQKWERRRERSRSDQSASRSGSSSPMCLGVSSAHPKRFNLEPSRSPRLPEPHCSIKVVPTAFRSMHRDLLSFWGARMDAKLCQRLYERVCNPFFLFSTESKERMVVFVQDYRVHASLQYDTALLWLALCACWLKEHDSMICTVVDIARSLASTASACRIRS